MPQIFNTFEIARPTYYDRNPVSASIQQSGVYAPHATVTRQTYAPAYPYAAFIETTLILLQRITVAVTTDYCQGSFVYTPFNVASVYTDSVLHVAQNTVRSSVKSIESTIGYMAYGDSISFQTTSNDNGGTMQFIGMMKGVEFHY